MLHCSYLMSTLVVHHIDLYSRWKHKVINNPVSYSQLPLITMTTDSFLQC